MAKKKKKRLSTILGMKCPNCFEGQLFKTNTWSFQAPFEMYEKCPNCELNYFPEPGFYWGAMFISYILWGGVSILIGGTSIIFFGMSVNQATLLLILISAIFFVWLFRISRSIWIHIAPGRPKKKVI